MTRITCITSGVIGQDQGTQSCRFQLIGAGVDIRGSKFFKVVVEIQNTWSTKRFSLR